MRDRIALAGVLVGTWPRATLVLVLSSEGLTNSENTMSLTNRSIVPAAVLMLVAGTVGLRATSSRNDFGNVYASRTQARLAFAKLSADHRDTTLGAAEGNVYVLNPTMQLAWTAADANRTTYFYQVAKEPFPPGPPTRDLPGVVAGGLATRGVFAIATRDFLRQVNSSRRAHNFFIRIVPVLNGKIVGPASNTVVVHYILGVDPDTELIVEHPVLWGDTVTAPPHPTSPSRAP